MRMDEKTEVRRMLENGAPDQAVKMINCSLEKGTNDDELYYLRGNAFMKLGDWKQAIESYMEALAINPQSPAKETLRMASDILEFRNKDLYNQ